MPERKPGLYWVRIMPTWPWTIGRYDGRHWTLLGRIGHREVAEVDERRIPDHE